jgi:hypothetical protein
MPLPLSTIFRGLFGKIRGFFTGTAEQTAGYAIGGASQAVLRPLFMALAKQVNYELPEELADAQAYVEAFIRGEISPADLHYYLRQQGLPDTVADMLVKIRDPLLNVGEIQVGYNRGLISEDEAVSRLRKLGYTDDEIPHLLKLAKYIPSVQDFVRFAVRECFTPAIAEKYGQYQDYPPEFEEYAKKAGLDPEYAKYYWAAHWELPSITMGFEMLHRGIIDYDELKVLLRALDVMPYWRDKLIQLSFNPYTRIDVRRMYKAGVLSKDEVFKAYKDLGYDDDHAGKMTQWVCNESNQDTRDLTKAEIMSLYEDRIISQDEVKSMLQTLAYQEEEIDMLINLSEYKKARERLNLVKSALESSYLAGLIDRNDALIYLEKFGLPASEVQDLLDTWDLKQEVRNTLPSKADIDKFYMSQLIDENVYKVMLRGLGYPDQIIDFYLTLVKGKLEEEIMKEAEKLKKAAEKEAKKKG